jgi:hypothetical protein
VFLASSVLEFSYSCFISIKFQLFNFCLISIFVNCTDLKLVRKQHWNFNELSFYIKNKHVIYRQRRSGWEKLCPRSWKRPSPFGLGPFSRPRVHFFSSGLRSR